MVFSPPLSPEEAPSPSSSTTQSFNFKQSGTSSFSSYFSSPDNGHQPSATELTLDNRAVLFSKWLSTEWEQDLAAEFAGLLTFTKRPGSAGSEMGLGLDIGDEGEKGEDMLNERLEELPTPILLKKPTKLSLPDLCYTANAIPSSCDAAKNALPSPSAAYSSSDEATGLPSSIPVPQAPFLRQVSKRFFTSTTTTTTTMRSPTQEYRRLPAHPSWQTKTLGADGVSHSTFNRARAASVRSYHSSEEEEDDEDQTGLKGRDVPGDSTQVEPPLSTRRRFRSMPPSQPSIGSLSSSIFDSSSVDSPKADHLGFPATKSAPGSSFNLAGMNPSKPSRHRAHHARRRTDTHRHSEDGSYSGSLRRDIASLLKTLETASFHSDPSPEESTSGEGASRLIPRSVSHLIAAPIVPIAQVLTLFLISFAAVVALSTVMLGSYGLTAWDEARSGIRQAHRRVQEGMRLFGCVVKGAKDVAVGVLPRLSTLSDDHRTPRPTDPSTAYMHTSLWATLHRLVSSPSTPTGLPDPRRPHSARGKRPTQTERPTFRSPFQQAFTPDHPAPSSRPTSPRSMVPPDPPKPRARLVTRQTTALPPRPPLSLLIPSIVLTLVIAFCAMAHWFLGGRTKGEAGAGEGGEKKKKKKEKREKKGGEVDNF